MSGIEEYQPGNDFPGTIGRTVEESNPAWPAPARARDGAPNVLFLVLDDVGYEFEPTGAPDFASGKGVPGRSQLYVDGDLVANAEFPHTVPFFFELEGLSCGYDFGAPASEGYEPPFGFNGKLHSVTFDVSGELIADDEAELARMMAQQ